MATREAVLLLHGLWMNRLAMIYLARKLERAGFAARAIGYWSIFDPMDANVARLARVVSSTDASRVHLVGHSLGALVALRYLQKGADARVGRAVLLGPPLAGCRAAIALQRIPGGRRLLGESLSVWNQPFETAFDPRYEVGVIAGTRPLGTSCLFTRLPKPNDGVVCVDETLLPAARDRLEIFVSHSGMLIDARVARATIAFLSKGKFA